jgi:hypothetical protein
MRTRLVGLMVMVLAVAVTPAAAGDYEDAMGYHQSRNYVQAMPLFLRATEQGDARAPHALAYMYGTGQGVPTDDVEALKWALLAQMRGNTDVGGLRALIEKRMSTEQIALAQERARQYAARPVRARQTFPPAGSGASAAAPAAGAATSTATSAEDAVLQAMEGWRAAWARRDADAYLAAYAPDLKLPATYPRARWEAQRRERVSRASLIIVRIANPVVSFAADGSATVRFTQTFQSNSYRETISKVLVMGDYGGKWLIREETGVRVKN